MAERLLRRTTWRGEARQNLAPTHPRPFGSASRVAAAMGGPHVVHAVSTAKGSRDDVVCGEWVGRGWWLAADEADGCRLDNDACCSLVCVPAWCQCVQRAAARAWQGGASAHEAGAVGHAARVGRVTCPRRPGPAHRWPNRVEGARREGSQPPRPWSDTQAGRLVPRSRRPGCCECPTGQLRRQWTGAGEEKLPGVGRLRRA
jgi:hypothetical protein